MICPRRPSIRFLNWITIKAKLERGDSVTNPAVSDEVGTFEPLIIIIFIPQHTQVSTYTSTHTHAHTLHRGPTLPSNQRLWTCCHISVSESSEKWHQVQKGVRFSAVRISPHGRSNENLFLIGKPTVAIHSSHYRTSFLLHHQQVLNHCRSPVEKNVAHLSVLPVIIPLYSLIRECKREKIWSAMELQTNRRSNAAVASVRWSVALLPVAM